MGGSSWLCFDPIETGMRDDRRHYLQGGIRQYCAVWPKPLKYFNQSLTEFMASMAPPVGNSGLTVTG
jgi:hypothetical protein